jgi:hypothetical protein
MPIQARQVPGFWPEDAEEAHALAVANRRNLRQQGFGEFDIQVKTSPNMRKPSPARARWNAGWRGRPGAADAGREVARSP